MTLATTLDHIAVVPIKRVERFVNGVLTPAEARDPFVIWGEVVAVGAGWRSPVTGERKATTLQKGDKVIYLRESVMSTYEDFTVDGVKHKAVCFIQERDIAILKRNDELFALNDYIFGTIVVDPEEFEEFEANGLKFRVPVSKTESGLLVVPTGKNVDEKVNKELYPVKVKVIHSGPGRWADKGYRIPNDVPVGSIALVSKWFAWEFFLKDNDPNGFVVVKTDSVYGVLLEG